MHNIDPAYVTAIHYGGRWHSVELGTLQLTQSPWIYQSIDVTVPVFTYEQPGDGYIVTAPEHEVIAVQETPHITITGDNWDQVEEHLTKWTNSGRINWWSRAENTVRVTYNNGKVCDYQIGHTITDRVRP